MTDLPAARRLVDELISQETSRHRHVRLVQLRECLAEPAAAPPAPPATPLPAQVQTQLPLQAAS